MSTPATKRFAGHGSSHDSVGSDCSSLRELARLPKGTLPERHATSRAGNYRPERIVIPGHGYQPFGEKMLHDKKPQLLDEFFSAANRSLIISKTLEAIRNSTKHKNITPEHVPGHVLDIAMNKAVEIFGKSTTNAPGLQVGPSESLPWQAREQKYDSPVIDFGSYTNADIAQLNHATAQLVRENILSEMALLSRYHTDLGGAVHVLEYPKLPEPDMHRKNHLIYRDFDDISSAEYTGISGNRLLPNRVIDSQRPGVNEHRAPGAPLAQHVGWGARTADYKTSRLPGMPQ